MDASYVLDGIREHSLLTVPAYTRPSPLPIDPAERPDETDPAWVEALLAAPYAEGTHDHYICVDDAYKVKFGSECYLRIALIEFEKGEDLSPYLHGDHTVYERKMKEGKLRQLDLVVDSWEADEEMAGGEEVDVYACSFFADHLGPFHKDTVYASGHNPNPHQRYVKVADVATKWMDDPEAKLVDYVNALNHHWASNPGVRGRESFEFAGRTVQVSDSVRERYEGPFAKLRSRGKAA